MGWLRLRERLNDRTDRFRRDPAAPTHQPGAGDDPPDDVLWMGRSTRFPALPLRQPFVPSRTATIRPVPLALTDDGHRGQAATG
jgi:hypothetical protein